MKALAATLSLVTALLALPATAGAQSYDITQFTGTVASSPAVAGTKGSNVLSVVVRGTDGNYYLETFNPTTNAWNGWDALGAPPGGAIGDAALVSWAPGRLDLFVRGADNKLWQRWRPTADSFWSPWIQPVGPDGILTSSPTASSRGPGRLDVFVLGNDGNVYQRQYEGDAGWSIGWLGQGKPAGTVGLVGNPSSTSGDGRQVFVFARGTDDKLWVKKWDGSTWSAWLKPVGDDGTLASSPAAVSDGTDSVVVFVRGTDQNLWARDLSAPAWRLDSATGANPIKDSPGAVVSGIDTISALVHGIDDKVYRTIYRVAVD